MHLQLLLSCKCLQTVHTNKFTVVIKPKIEDITYTKNLRSKLLFAILRGVSAPHFPERSFKDLSGTKMLLFMKRARVCDLVAFAS